MDRCDHVLGPGDWYDTMDLPREETRHDGDAVACRIGIRMGASHLLSHPHSMGTCPFTAGATVL